MKGCASEIFETSFEKIYFLVMNKASYVVTLESNIFKISNIYDQIKVEICV